ncbi:hypothetical protein VTP01DRAFT_8190 [Rhizomucor pusillus]|uniref:uncharacterized protein n=1 Tax=Rhizomucor pusillus TaxID=4840 RepID=UPI0037447C1C
MFQPEHTLAFPPFDTSALPPAATSVAEIRRVNADISKSQQLQMVHLSEKSVEPQPAYPLIEILKQYPDLSQFIEHPQCEVFTKLWCQVQQNIALAKDPYNRPVVQENLNLIAVKLEHCLNIAPAFYSTEEDCESQTSRINAALKKLLSQVLTIRKLLYLVEERRILFDQNPMEAVAPLVETLVRAKPHPQQSFADARSISTTAQQQSALPVLSLPLPPPPAAPVVGGDSSFLQTSQVPNVMQLSECLTPRTISYLNLQQEQQQHPQQEIIRHQEPWSNYPAAMSNNMDISSVPMQSTSSFTENPMLFWSWPTQYDTITLYSESTTAVVSTSANPSFHQALVSSQHPSQHLIEQHAYVHPTAILTAGPWTVPNTPCVELNAPITSYIRSCPPSPRQQWMQPALTHAAPTPPSQQQRHHYIPPSFVSTLQGSLDPEQAQQQRQQAQCSEEEADSQQSSGTSTVVETEDNDTEYEPTEGDESSEPEDDDDDDEYTETKQRTARHRSKNKKRQPRRRSSSSTTTTQLQQACFVRRPRTTRKFTRRTATSYDAETTHYLKSVFFNIYSQREKMSKDQRRQVQEQTGLKPRNITYWFSNHKRRFQASLLVFKHTVRESKGKVKTYDDFLQWRRQRGLPDDVSESEAKAIFNGLPPSSSDEQEALV